VLYLRAAGSILKVMQEWADDASIRLVSTSRPPCDAVPQRSKLDESRALGGASGRMSFFSGALGSSARLPSAVAAERCRCAGITDDSFARIHPDRSAHLAQSPAGSRCPSWSDRQGAIPSPRWIAGPKVVAGEIRGYAPRRRLPPAILAHIWRCDGGQLLQVSSASADDVAPAEAAGQSNRVRRASIPDDVHEDYAAASGPPKALARRRYRITAAFHRRCNNIFRHFVVAQ